VLYHYFDYFSFFMIGFATSPFYIYFLSGAKNLSHLFVFCFSLLFLFFLLFFSSVILKSLLLGYNPHLLSVFVCDPVSRSLLSFLCLVLFEIGSALFFYFLLFFLSFFLSFLTSSSSSSFTLSLFFPCSLLSFSSLAFHLSFQVRLSVLYFFFCFSFGW